MRMFCVAFLFSALAGIISATAEPLDEATIRELVSGNTITGRSVEGRFFSEYHLPDGKVLGDNGYYINTDACWTTKPGQICYYYGEGKARNIHCFALEQKGEAISMTIASATLRRGELDAVAKIEKGNPRSHSDGGKSWFCDGLISQANPGAARRITGAIRDSKIEDMKTCSGAVQMSWRQIRLGSEE